MRAADPHTDKPVVDSCPLIESLAPGSQGAAGGAEGNRAHRGGVYLGILGRYIIMCDSGIKGNQKAA